MESSERRKCAEKTRRVSERHKAILAGLAESLRQQSNEQQEQLIGELESERLLSDATTEETGPDGNSE